MGEPIESDGVTVRLINCFGLSVKNRKGGYGVWLTCCLSE